MGIVNLSPTEHHEQVSIFREAAIREKTDPRWGMLYATPNGGKRSIGTAVKLKAEGVKAGVPDMFLAVPRGEFHGLYIELKRIKGGVTSEEQRDWLSRLALQGYDVEICRGAQAAIDRIAAYLGKPDA